MKVKLINHGFVRWMSDRLRIFSTLDRIATLKEEPNPSENAEHMYRAI